MRVKLRVEFADGNVENITATYPDLAKFEETFNRSVAKFEDEVRLSDLGWLAWHVLFRCQKTTKDYANWALSVEVVEPDHSDGDAAAPLVP